LTTSLQFYDILHQQSNISRMVDALSRSDSEVNAIYNYIMLNLSYRFNNTAGNDNKRSKGQGLREYGMPPAGMAPPAGMMPPGGGRPF
jgi:hypothetical protein